ncbi:hypothetical protein BSU04_07840 [Caballeronia sordidicola]|uniref:Uncharacterized protein n=1 Tax=Caballeronia sordidicola TaxID=196367 RepID=A0A226X8A7_CABSO|nr:hypothetical protein BSU04_07840 [Caballeronia sordidicola]
MGLRAEHGNDHDFDGLAAAIAIAATRAIRALRKRWLTGAEQERGHHGRQAQCRDSCGDSCREASRLGDDAGAAACRTKERVERGTDNRFHLDGTVSKRRTRGETHDKMHGWTLPPSLKYHPPDIHALSAL